MKLWGLSAIRCRQCTTRFYLSAQAVAQIETNRRWLHAVHNDTRGFKSHQN
jgi:hypothetical protein